MKREKGLRIKAFYVVLVLLLTFVLSGCPAPIDEELNCTENQIEENGECVEKEPDPDTVLPVFSGVHNLTYTIGEDEPDYLDGVSASDDVDGDLTSSIVMDCSGVDLTTAGEYTVTLTVTDSAGNVTTETITVTVSTIEVDYCELAEQDMAEIEIVEDIGVVSDATKITLPRFGTNSSNYSWTSSDPTILSSSGFVQNPPVGSEATPVTLSVRVVNGNCVKEKDFVVTVAPNEEVEVTSSIDIPFDNISNQYDTPDLEAVKIFFVDNGAVPYIDIEEYINMLDGIFEAEKFTFKKMDNQLEISYHPEINNYYLFYPSEDSTPEESVEFTALFDFTENTVTFNTYMFFTHLGTTNNPVESLGFMVTNLDYEMGDEIVIPLGEYNFDILIHDDGVKDNYLLPYHIIELFFTNTLFYSTFYKPEGIIGEDTSWDIDPVPLITSELNGETIPYDVKTASFNMLLLTLDYFSSLKEINEVESFKESLALNAEGVMMSNGSAYYTKLGNILVTIDHLKAIPTTQGYYSSDPIVRTTTPEGPKVRAYNEAEDAMIDKLLAMNGNSMPSVRYLEDGKTAVFYFYFFDRAMPDLFKTRLDALPEGIENVVIDLSYNRGGNVGAVFRMFGYMTDDQLSMNMVNPRTNQYITYFIDNNLPTYDYNWYVASTNATINAGSVFSAAANQLPFVTHIGSKSTGSTSIYDIMSLPCGFVYTLPVYNTFYGYDGEDVDGNPIWIDLEFGTDPEYYVSDLTIDQEVIDAIEEHQVNTTQ